MSTIYAALMQLTRIFRKFPDAIAWNEARKWVHAVDNWGHSDALSGIYAGIRERNPSQVEADYRLWNENTNPWLRRQSLVGLYYYARLRKKIPSTKIALSLIKARLKDPHFYVQKAVGWTLREVDRVARKEQRLFVEENLGSISSTAWFATSELYSATLKTRLVEERKILRNNQKTLIERKRKIL